MPGLISSKRYEASKSELCESDPRTQGAIEALEWRLMHSSTVAAFPVVPENGATDGKSAIRSIVVDPSPHTRGVVGVFTTEIFGGEEKILLLDVWVTENGEDID